MESRASEVNLTDFGPFHWKVRYLAREEFEGGSSDTLLDGIHVELSRYHTR